MINDDDVCKCKGGYLSSCGNSLNLEIAKRGCFRYQPSQNLLYLRGFYSDNERGYCYIIIREEILSATCTLMTNYIPMGRERPSGCILLVTLERLLMSLSAMRVFSDGSPGNSPPKGLRVCWSQSVNEGVESLLAFRIVPSKPIEFCILEK